MRSRMIAVVFAGLLATAVLAPFQLRPLSARDIAQGKWEVVIVAGSEALNLTNRPLPEEERILKAYLRRKFEALGLEVTGIDSLPTISTWFEVHFSVMETGQGTYDVAAVLVIAQRREGEELVPRSAPFDWHQYSAYRDLEDVAREMAESYYSGMDSWWEILRLKFEAQEGS